MNQIRRSVVWIPTTEEFSAIVAQSTTLTEIARKVGADPQAGTFKIIKRRLTEENIDYSHISLGLNNRKGHQPKRLTIPLQEVMVEHSPYSRKSLKRRLLKEGILKNECSICGLNGVWNNKPLRMRLDHINGVNDDCRKENLRMVCPNCDSQLPTYCNGNTKRRHKRAEGSCVDCGISLQKRSSVRCKACRLKWRIEHPQTRVNWPSLEELKVKIAATNTYKVACELGVSWNAVRRHLQRHSLTANVGT